VLNGCDKLKTVCPSYLGEIQRADPLGTSPNNVEERLKLLGSFTGVSDDGEEVVLPATLSGVCKQFYQERLVPSETQRVINNISLGRTDALSAHRLF
jgi:hypothetical protein